MGPICSLDPPAGALSNPSNGKDPRLVREACLQGCLASTREVPHFALFEFIASNPSNALWANNAKCGTGVVDASLRFSLQRCGTCVVDVSVLSSLR
jgi:hypothetical protein